MYTTWSSSVSYKIFYLLILWVFDSLLWSVTSTSFLTSYFFIQIILMKIRVVFLYSKISLDLSLFKNISGGKTCIRYWYEWIYSSFILYKMRNFYRGSYCVVIPLVKLPCWCSFTREIDLSVRSYIWVTGGRCWRLKELHGDVSGRRFHIRHLYYVLNK
jgi:hypothetical protein